MNAHRLLRLLPCIVGLLLTFPSFCQQPNFRKFENIYVDSDAPAVSCFIQDREGMVWIGTSKGLFSYDGYTTHSHFSSEEGTDLQVHCGVTDGKDHLYLGTDNGILVYNYKTDKYDSHITIPSSVRALALDGATLWIGSLNGLYKISLGNTGFERVDGKTRGIPNPTIYAIAKTGGKLYIGTYDGLCTYDPSKNLFTPVKLPKRTGKSNVFVNSLLEDRLRGCLWIGTEGSLFQYKLSTGAISSVGKVEQNSIKSLALDSRSALLVGTDNGLYTYSEKDGWNHILHDSRNATSLTNNIIWSIFADKDKNCWFGTDYGVSISLQDGLLEHTPISQMSGNGNGNRFTSIFIDSQRNYWFGGSNGLLLTKNGKMPTIWYKMDEPTYPLSHNRVRKIYQDRHDDLWIATDGSLNRFDYRSKRFIHYSIVDKSGQRNANWCYDMFEDDDGKLWIATFLGGIFIVDKKELTGSKVSPYIATQNLTTANGLTENYISQLVPDKNGKVWVLFRNRSVNLIDVKSKRVENSGGLTNGQKPEYIFCDSEGYVWLGLKGSLLRINPADKSKTTVTFDEFSPKEVLSMAEENNRLWVSTTTSVWVINRKTLKTEQRISCISSISNHYTSICFDKSSGKVLLGGIDGYASVNTASLGQKERDNPITLTSLLVNSKAVSINRNDEPGIRFTSGITLKHNQNNLTFEFSDLRYAFDQKSSFIYKLEGLSDLWMTLNEEDNRISFSNLQPGSYKLVICKLSLAGTPSAIVKELTVKILPPWYLSLIAKLIYLFAFIGTVIWIINFFVMRSKLRMERAEKSRSLEQTKMKIDFFTNISHELKTPLSLVIAPISKLLYDSKDSEQKNQLRIAHQNAMKINSLIHQALDFDRIDGRARHQLILSRTDITEFAKSLFDVFADTQRDKMLTFGFSSNVAKLSMDIDVVKMESVLNNIISNAIKFSKDGGKIDLSLTYSAPKKRLQIELRDNGIGIAEQDLPHIFQRFFKASNAKDNQEGTGIGLYLVKTYAELHGGTVEIESKLEEGTTLTITLPVKEHEATQQVSSGITGDNKNAPEILIVEDNSDIADVICSTLGDRFRFVRASNGKAGLTAALAGAPDLIISDVMMPVMDGIEMCRRLRKNTGTSTTPIILLSAKNNSDIEKDSILFNIDAIVEKPFDPEMLKLKVEQTLQKSKLLEEKIRIETIAAPKPAEVISVNEKFLTELISIIEENISNSDFNVNELSKQSDISPKQLYRRVKQLTGYTPVEYIKTIRMKKAAMLLEQNKFTVAEVMYLVGFSNHSYFSRCFQSEFGKTPRQFMDEKKQ